MCIIESLCYIPETNTTLQINLSIYMSIKKQSQKTNLAYFQVSEIWRD